MSKSLSALRAVKLKIAGIVVELLSGDVALLRALAGRYLGFTTQQPAQLTLQVEWVGQLRSIEAGFPDVQFWSNGVRLSAPGYDGCIDLETQRAVLTLSSANPVEEVEYFLRVIYAVLAFEAGGLMVHAAGVVRNERAYVFLGHSGSGKTTVARLSEDCQVLNDDLLVLWPEQASWIVYGTPFWNPTQVKPGGQHAALTMLLRLVQDQQVSLVALSLAQAVAEMVANVPVISADAGRSQQVLQRCFSIVRSVPGYSLHFLPEPSFWRVIREVEGEF